MHALDINGHVWRFVYDRIDNDSWEPLSGYDLDGRPVPPFVRAWHWPPGAGDLLALDINGRVWRFEGDNICHERCWWILNFDVCSGDTGDEGEDAEEEGGKGGE